MDASLCKSNWLLSLCLLWAWDPAHYSYTSIAAINWTVYQSSVVRSDEGLSLETSA